MKAVKPEIDLPKMERDLLQRWSDRKIFEASNDLRRGGKEFAFYDGPPFANGLPHYGHLLANTIKDIVPRYWVMRGYYVNRRFGWDCHGVPVEYEIEKRDNLKGSGSIKSLGVGEFNERCRASVLHYANEWKGTITRLGRWVDWNDQYRTMDRSFMESVWWVFSELNKKGLVYRSHKVVPYSPRITSVVSNFEANQNYKMTQDPSVYLKIKIKGKDESFLAWTTTPWTLISNLALAVGPDIDYVKVKHLEDGQIYWLAEARVDAVFKKAKDKSNTYEILERTKGVSLKGLKYEPLFPYFANNPNSFQILVDSYVTTSDGTGIVHQAPAYGEDDYRVCQENGIPFVDPIDEEGNFKDVIPELKGVNFKEADKEISRRLRAEGKLFRQETIDHSYPFCERTDTPLMYRAIPAWFVSVEKQSQKLVANNKKINWVPGHLRDGRMGNWLENAKDWAVSRNRFWGTPLPIWVCDKDDSHYEVFGDIKSVEEKTGSKLPDIHKHFVDELTYKCSHCGGGMKRVPEVFDCWFESGSMPYAQMHYPFENQDRFNKSFPADFIAEGLDQTRGWFYTLSVLSTSLFDRPAFKNVVVNGIICDETGKKMSKRHRNYTPPDELLEKFGADAARLYMVNSPILRGEDLIFSDKGVLETIRAVLLPLWNAQSFLTTYAEADGWKPDPSLLSGAIPNVTDDMDRWIISRLHTLMNSVQNHMENYLLYLVVPEVLSFIDDLTNWYIRLNRRRFWGGERESSDKAQHSDQIQAFSTLYYVLVEFTKVFAPFAPFVSERVYLNLTEGVAGAKDSVHLCDMPVGSPKAIDIALEESMALTRRVTELGRSLRAKHQLKTRQPLASLLVITRNASDKEKINRSKSLICDELNIKQLDFSTDEAQYLMLGVKPNLKTLGKKLGAALNPIRVAFENLSKSQGEVSAFLAKVEGDGKIEFQGQWLTVEDLLIDRGPKDERLIATDVGVTVLLDTKLTSDLIQEGFSREFVNRVQTLRKDSNLNVSDRINLAVSVDLEGQKSLELFKNYVCGETLAKDIVFTPEANISKALEFTTVTDIEGRSVSIALGRA
ncbi:MAG: isoleucine--tRNA ligase [Proteobacteria bacterium]|nr:isoleucine--tRNA ligase [Pseudomonadota bacterium]